MMPLMTSRFRRGFTPRRYIGIEASIEAYCSSLSQNRFDIVARSLNVEASNRTRCSHVKQKLGSEPSARPLGKAATCPARGPPSVRIHSRYRRTLTDLPSQGLRVVLIVCARRFRCVLADCPQRIFAERLET